MIGGHCHVCGQRAHNPLRHFGHAVEEVFESFWHLDGRIFRTLRDLFVPGRVAIGYLAGHRVRYVAPLRLFIILSLITFFVGKLTLHVGPEDGLEITAKPSDGGFVVGNTRLDANHFSAAKSADEVLAIRAKALADIAAEERDSETGMILSTILDVAKEQIDARARQRMSELGLGVWWRKLGADGTNVNELTSQRLTDIGRAPTFYDCLVEVKPCGAGR